MSFLGNPRSFWAKLVSKKLLLVWGCFEPIEVLSLGKPVVFRRFEET